MKMRKNNHKQANAYTHPMRARNELQVVDLVEVANNFSAEEIQKTHTTTKNAGKKQKKFNVKKIRQEKQRH